MIKTLKNIFSFKIFHKVGVKKVNFSAMNQKSAGRYRKLNVFYIFFRMYKSFTLEKLIKIQMW